MRTFISMSLAGGALGLAALLGCSDALETGDGIGDAFLGGKADGEIAEGTPDACAALGAANQATLEQLDDEAGLTANAARSIVEHRPFANLIALDEAPYVGPVALEKLVAYGQALGIECPTSALANLHLRGSFFGIQGFEDSQDEYFAGGLIGYTVTLRKDVTVGLRALAPWTTNDGLVDVWGPIPSAEDLAAAPHVAGPSLPDAFLVFRAPVDGVYLVTAHGESGERGFVRVSHWLTLFDGDDDGMADPAIACGSDADCPPASACGPNRARLSFEGPARVCNPTLPGPWHHGQCDEAGGEYRNVTVTADEACAMVDFLNHAPYSALGEIDPYDQWTYDRAREGRYRVLAHWARTEFEFESISSGAVAAVKVAAATRSDDGVAVEDTVARTFANRSVLRGKTVYMPAVRAIRRVADGPSGEQCIEIRDTDDAPNYLYACECAGNPACSPGHASVTPGDRVGQTIAVRGALHYTDGHWRIDASSIEAAP